jgi:DNA-binding Lrp family transcriptional regulator
MALNFFSILLSEGLKIARDGPTARRSPPTPRSRHRPEGAAKMRSARLDATDWRILRELQADGRITNVELARKVGISAPPCLRRVRALEEAGIIKGFTTILNDRALGFDVTAFAMIRLHSQAEADLIAFEERARASSIVRDCYMLSGEIDFLLKCVAPDLTAFQDFIIHELTAAPNVASVKTSLVIRASKHAEGVPVELAGGKAQARPLERART